MIFLFPSLMTVPGQLRLCYLPAAWALRCASCAWLGSCGPSCSGPLVVSTRAKHRISSCLHAQTWAFLSSLRCPSHLSKICVSYWVGWIFYLLTLWLLLAAVRSSNFCWWFPQIFAVTFLMSCSICILWGQFSLSVLNPLKRTSIVTKSLKSLTSSYLL